MNEMPEISLRERIRINLVSAMEHANINQVQLAERLGISKGTVNNWARGNNSPDVDMVPKICNVLGISILDLYSPTDFEPQSVAESAKKSPSTAEAAPGEEVQKLLEYLNDALIRMGFIGEEDDLTDQQLNVLLGICTILRATFDQEQ